MTDDELLQRLSLLVLDVRELVAERDQLRADNERLRAALATIEAGYAQRLSAAELASMARQAL